ncbi:DUF2147 domain-containing protein [Roseibium aggregatum]|uniref:DUF2147 domain-containing protein n=1 Tax=Roseibium aggregatum TaxID=187304 RepID=A0A926NYE3_9HYPH|nr:DUF2147 domain-containing protein [Roseibium aggregatum]MBD1546003.1 DUF2147 domain-containing protein [Roseibium aggregatum]
MTTRTARSHLIRLLLGGALLTATVAASHAADATGEWIRPSGSSKIRISPCGDALCGKLIWLREPRNDTQNPDPARRSRPLLGVQIVNAMKPTGTAGQWKGEVYNAEDGKTYTGYLKLTAPDSLKLQGCVLGGLICKGETWHRAK